MSLNKDYSDTPPVSVIVVVFLLSFAAVLYAMTWYFTLPVVLISNSTGECVAVYPSSAGTCSDMPKKYVSDWVQ